MIIIVSVVCVNCVCPCSITVIMFARSVVRIGGVARFSGRRGVAQEGGGTINRRKRACDAVGVQFHLPLNLQRTLCLLSDEIESDKDGRGRLGGMRRMT